MIVRSLLILPLALAACAGSPGVGVTRTVDSLPNEPERRAEELESVRARPGPERKDRASPALERAERAAATAAALVGILFSEGNNASMGILTPVDENLLFSRDRQRPPSAEGDREQPSSGYDGASLVPWIELPSKEDVSPADGE